MVQLDGHDAGDPPGPTRMGTGHKDRGIPATQINESTLSFIPRLVAMFITLIFAGPWMLQLMIDYIRRLFESIPSLIG